MILAILLVRSPSIEILATNKCLTLNHERVMMEMNITRTGVLWKLKTQTQRHALELFLFDCWEKMQQFTEEEIRQIRLKNKRFPLVPANATVSDDICVLL